MWIDVTKRLPGIGRRVHVAGDHTPSGTGYPVAYRREDDSNRRGWRWESTEWRGTAGVRWWWDDTAIQAKT